MANIRVNLNNDNVRRVNAKWFILIFVFVVVLFSLSWLYLYYCHTDQQERGTFGDQFGFVNALFSGLAFAGLICTILLQKNELTLQREELAYTRAEMERQTTQFKNQNDTLRIQRFENTFFSMLSLQQQIVNELSFHFTDKVMVREDSTDPTMRYLEKEIAIDKQIVGRDLFRYAFVEAVHYLEDTHRVYGIGRAMRREGFGAYKESYTPTYFDHYFRHLYTILKFVNQNEWLGEQQQYRYASLLRATLSRYELVWLFYNGLSDYGCEKFKPLIERYSMLKNLRTDLLTLCKENYILLQQKNIVDEYEARYSGTDFEFHIIECGIKDSEKYQLSAFYNEDEIVEGQKLLNNWRAYMKRYGLTP